MQDFIHCTGMDFSQIATQGKDTLFKWNMFNIWHKEIVAVWKIGGSSVPMMDAVLFMCGEYCVN